MSTDPETEGPHCISLREGFGGFARVAGGITLTVPSTAIASANETEMKNRSP